MHPNYIAGKSVWGECGGTVFLCFLFFWLIVPLIIGICLIVKVKKFRLEFYDTYILTYEGLLSTSEHRSLLTTIVGVRIDQTFGGHLFNYGDLHVDVVGKWDVNTHAIKDPASLKHYLETLMSRTDPRILNQVLAN